MNNKQRDVIFQHWSSLIGRETRDLASLEHIGTRALASHDVRDDSTLQGMIQAELQRYRAELEEKSKEESSIAPPTSKPNWRSELPVPVYTPTPEQNRDCFNQLAQALLTSLECCDEKETLDIFGKMRVLHEKSPGAIPADVIGECKQRVDAFRSRMKKLTDEIAALTQQAVSASREGSEHDLAQLMRRLTVIHAGHPYILDELGLEDVRCDIAEAANDRREHQLTTKKLLERERAISDEIKAIATSVRNFHQAACTAHDTSEAFRNAEAAYLQAIRNVSIYDAEWFSGVVLELAGLLAEWTEPPQGAKSQIDHFLDRISTGLENIRAEMRQIEIRQNLDESKMQSP